MLLFGRALDTEVVAAEVDAVTPEQIAGLMSRILGARKAAVAILGPKPALAAAEVFQGLFA